MSFTTIINYIDVVLTVVAAVEKALPSTTAGAIKKSTAMSIINPPSSDIENVSNLVDNIVAVFNRHGIFSKPISTLATKGT